MLSATELVRKFESAAQNLVDQKLPKQMVTLTEGEQHLEQYEMVLFICNLYTHFNLQLTTILFENKQYVQSTVSIGLFLYS